MPLRRVCALASLVLFVVGCSSKAASDPCASEPVDALKELLVVDQAVTSDPRGKNSTDGPWSFRYAAENLAPVGADAGEFVRQWLIGWVTTKEVNGYLVDTPHEERVDSMNHIILCPWLKRTADNACNDDCSVCSAQKLDLAKAPFRFLGIANRLDERETIDGLPSGEGRLIFGLTDGAGDDPASRALAMTLIFEYVLPESHTPKQWAETWHALGRHQAFDEAYRIELQSITDSFVERGARPGAVNDSALGQIRTNEVVLDWIWQLREFALSDDGSLQLKPVRNTPAQQLNTTDRLRDILNANAAAIRTNKYELPRTILAGSADALRYSWNVPGVDTETQRAFIAGTCNGCHTNGSAVDTAFHISPFRDGVEKLSPFLWNPSADTDELRTRSDSLRRALCGN